MKPVGRPVAFWLMAYLFAVGMLGTTLPTPLYVIYEGQWHFSSATVTVIFATYAVGVILSLFLAGRASDSAGRRPVLGVAVLLASLSTAVFVVASGVGMLLAGRVLSGLAAGLITGTATAALSELAGASETRRASLVATAANIGGLGLGPLVAGLFAQFGPDPTVLVFEVYLGLLGLASVALVLCPETVSARGRAVVGFHGFGVPREGSDEFVAASIAGFSAFTVLGLFSALAPSFLGSVLHERNHAVGGGIVFLLFAVATLTQIVFWRAPSRKAVLGGLGWLLVSLALIVTGLSQASMPIFVVGTVTGGFGTGLVFMGSLATANALAPEERRGQVISTYFLAAYVGLTIPVIGVGIASEHVGDFRATLFCAIVLASLASLSALVIHRAGRLQVAREG